MTDPVDAWIREQVSALGNNTKTAQPGEYLELVKEKAERRREKWFRSKEYQRRLQSGAKGS